MPRHFIKPAVLTAAAVLAVTGSAIIPSSAAYASTQCVAGQNAGYSNGGSGDNYWGWCRPGGGFVRYYLAILCDQIGWQVTGWGTGSGVGTIYTNAVSCPTQIDGYQIVNG